MLTVKSKKLIILEIFPSVPLTSTVYVPAGVEKGILIVKVVEQSGEQEVGEKKIMHLIADPKLNTR